MVVRRAALVAALLALAAMGLASGTAGAVGRGRSAPFQHLKPVEAASSCTNDPGISYRKLV